MKDIFLWLAKNADWLIIWLLAFLLGTIIHWWHWEREDDDE